MKKTLALILAAVMLLSLAACGAKPAVTVDYGESEMYTKEQLAEAAKLIEKTIDGFEGDCELHSLTYLGDERSGADLAYIASLGLGDYNNCMVFGSSFRSPKDGGGAWEPDTEYTWEFYLGSENGTDWEVVTYGY
ncbi:MAG: hypothetical protein IJS31_03970 [Oscillospiraceae bacterium]|nr:hypothetical protein [Oscillospiraceae bacterium]